MDIILPFVTDQPWFGVVAAAIALASAIAAVTPTPKKGTTLAKVYSFLDLMALNIAKAKQTGDEPDKK